MKFLVLGIGGDARYGYVAKALTDDGYTVTKDPAEADVVVLPFQAVGPDGIHVWGTDEVYAEIMARIRKCPATSYLMCALVPLIPGSGIYYTMDFIRRSMLPEAYDKGMLTAAIAGSMAVGVLLVSTGFRMWGVWRNNRKRKQKKA